MSAELFSAIRVGDTSKVSALVDDDAGLLEAQDESGLGPFTVARYSRQDEIANLLLKRGARLDIFAVCIAGVSTRVVELLGADSSQVNSYSHDGWTPLHLAAFFGHRDIAEVLLAHGADVNARQHGGWSPLQAAAQSGDVELVRLLIANGADVKARAGNNQSALDLALTKGHQASVDLLEQHGASQ